MCQSQIGLYSILIHNTYITEVKHVFLQDCWKRNGLCSLMVITRKQVHYCFLGLKTALTFSTLPSTSFEQCHRLISTGCVQCSRLAPLRPLRAQSLLRFHQQAPSLCPPTCPPAPLSSPSSPPAPSTRSLPSHPRLCSNAFLRPLVLKIRVNPNQLRSTLPPPVLLFLLAHCSKIISVSH